ncbi:MAG: glycoside hydrolase family 9 protein, partial [Anaerolineae bacterium]|nr:glycoside hydrolase family 9 protein [Phycisphaerae bacterium]
MSRFEQLETRTLFSVGTPSDLIIVDQFGWRANAPRKVAIFADPVNGQNSAGSYSLPVNAPFQVLRVSDDSVAHSGTVTQWKAGQTDAVSGDRVWYADFSSLTAPGDYYIYDSTNNRRSFPFKLDNLVFDSVLKTSLRTFFYQRAGTAIDAAHGINWTHAAGHVGPNQDHAARLWTGSNQGQPRDLWGGWYDAGDYNKYVPFTTSVMWNLLNAYEWNPAAYGDNTNIPESGNGVPDTLDEIKWELDWLLRMQNVNGSVLNRNANATYNAGNYDPSTDTQPRYYTQATTWATSSFIAAIAHGARVFENFDAQYPGYSTTLRMAAENAWNYLAATPNMTPASGTDGGGGGGSNGVSGGLAAAEASSDANGDRRLRVFAAAELYKTTGSATYKSYFEANYKNANTSDNGFHPLTDATPRFDSSVAADLNRAFVTYATTPGASATIVSEIKNALRNNITQSWLAVGEYTNQTDPYRSFMWDGHYTWGSNSLKSEWANILMYAVRLNVGTQLERDRAKEAAEEYLHYFHGRNPLSMVYLTNTGSIGAERSAMQPYHSWFGDGSPLYDGPSSTFGPPPGYLVGGPNQFFSVSTISPPRGEPPMKAFKDWNTSFPENSWEITEPAIYYQAAYSLLASHFTGAQFASVSNNKLTITGTFENDTISLGASGTDYTVTMNGQALSFAKASVNQIEVMALSGDDALSINAAITAPLTFTGGAGIDTVNVTGAGSVTFTTSQTIDALSISNSGVATLATGGGKVLVVSSLVLGASAKLGLTDNNLIVNYTSGSPRATIQSAINTARAGGAWNGFGLTSLAAQS